MSTKKYTFLSLLLLGVYGWMAMATSIDRGECLTDECERGHLVLDSVKNRREVLTAGFLGDSTKTLLIGGRDTTGIDWHALSGKTCTLLSNHGFNAYQVLVVRYGTRDTLSYRRCP